MRIIRLPRTPRRVGIAASAVGVVAAVGLVGTAVAAPNRTSAAAAKPTVTQTVTQTVTAPAQTVTVAQPPQTVTSTVTVTGPTVTVTAPPSSTTTSPTTTPTTSATTTAAASLCSTIPSLTGVKPTAANTGVPAGTTLTPSGTINVQTPGAVLDGLDVNGTIIINANNVTVRNSRVHSTSVVDYIAIIVRPGFTGLTVLNNELYTPNGGGLAGVDTGDDVKACGNYVHGFENGLTVGGGSIVQANFVEKLNDPDTTPAHPDCVEVYLGSNVQVIGNNLTVSGVDGRWLGATGAVNVTTEWSNISNVTVQGNWVGGGSFTLYVRTSGNPNGFTYSDINLIGNRFYGSAPIGFAQYGPLSTNGGDVEFTGNVWDADGTPVQAG